MCSWFSLQGTPSILTISEGNILPASLSSTVIVGVRLILFAKADHFSKVLLPFCFFPSLSFYGSCAYSHDRRCAGGFDVSSFSSGATFMFAEGILATSTLLFYFIEFEEITAEAATMMKETICVLPCWSFGGS